MMQHTAGCANQLLTYFTHLLTHRTDSDILTRRSRRCRHDDRSQRLTTK